MVSVVGLVGVEGAGVVCAWFVDLEEIYCAIKSEASRKLISSSYAPVIVPVVGSHWQSASLSTADGVKHCLAISP